MNSILPVALYHCSREKLLEYFKNTWELQHILLKSLSAESAFFLVPDSLRNPLIFYLGHPAAFYINKLLQSGLLKNGVNPVFEDLFSIGVDPESPEEFREFLQTCKWPTVEEVWAYRNSCFEAIVDIILGLELKLPITNSDPAWAILMGIEHDRIHFETSSVLIRQIPVHLVTQPAEWSDSPICSSPIINRMIFVPGGTVQLGKPNTNSIYGWDNEYGHLQIEVQPFHASQCLVSNQEYLLFVEDKGYLNPKYWSEEAWKWRETYQVTCPKFWIPSGKSFVYRAMFEERNMPWDWPAEVNHHEAMAYCRWKGEDIRLLTEAEWNHILNREESESLATLNYDRYNLNLKFGSPTPVQMRRDDDKAFSDIRGNVWCWLTDDFYPLSGFQPHSLYPDFSIPFFTEKHSMMIGGSWATTGTAASRYYRLWFRRHFYQHAGFRIAQT